MWYKIFIIIATIATIVSCRNKEHFEDDTKLKKINTLQSYTYQYNNIYLKVITKDTTSLKLYTNLYNNNPVLNLNERIRYLSLSLLYINLSKITIRFEKITKYNEVTNEKDRNDLIEGCLGNVTLNPAYGFNVLYETDSKDFFEVPIKLNKPNSSGVFIFSEITKYIMNKNIGNSYVPVCFEITSSDKLSDKYIYYGLSNITLGYYDKISNNVNDSVTSKSYNESDNDYNYSMIYDSIKSFTSTDVFTMKKQLVNKYNSKTPPVIINNRCEYDNKNINVPTYSEFVDYFIGVKDPDIV
jgi:hypothetical protein